MLLRIKSSNQPDMSAHTCGPSIYQAVRIRVQGHSGPCFKKKKKITPPTPKSIHIHRTKGAYFTFKLRMIVEAAPHLKGPFPRPRKAARGSPQSRLSARRNSPGPALSSAIFNETSSQLTLSADGCGQGFPVISGVKDDLSDLCVCVKSFGDHWAF